MTGLVSLKKCAKGEVQGMKSQEPGGKPHTGGFGNQAEEYALHITDKWGDNEGM